MDGHKFCPRCRLPLCDDCGNRDDGQVNADCANKDAQIRPVGPARAIARHYKKHIVYLCARGHYLTHVPLDKNWGGSMYEVEVGCHQRGEPNVFDRMASRCTGFGCADA